MKIKNQEVLLKIFLQEHCSPEEIRKFFPKRIACPLGYFDPKYMSGHMLYKTKFPMKFDDIQLAGPEKADTVMRIATLRKRILENLCTEKFPYYFVKQDLIDSVMNTNPPEFKIESLKLPRNPIVFVWPNNAFKQFTTRQCAYSLIGYVENEVFISHWLCTFDDFHGEFIYAAKRDSDYSDVIAKDFKDVVIYKDEFNVAIESMASIKLTDFLLKLLLILNSRPKLIQEVETHWGKTNGKTNPKTIWNPLWIGLSYKVTQESHGTHASPITHWRCGHIRNQHYGPMNSLSKVIWIEPVLVGMKEQIK